MQKSTKKEREKTYKNTSHGAYIVDNRLYIWPRKPTGQCCLTISDKYTLKLQINLIQLNFSDLRPRTRMYIIMTVCVYLVSTSVHCPKKTKMFL